MPSTTQNRNLEAVFDSFATFGGSKTNLNAVPALDNAKFAKLCRDTKIVGKNVTTVDVDIVFKKVLTKGDRKINFDAFLEALQHLAAVKYPNDSTGFDKLTSLVITNGAPTNSGSQPAAVGIFDKLTDKKLYTGTQKAKFQEDGRDDLKPTRSVSSIAANPKSAKRGVTTSMEAVNKQEKTTKPPSAKSSTATLSKKSGGVFDRLTNSTAYTGTHKHRFDESGRGRGLAGRDSAVTDTNVHSISKILRN